MIFAGNINIGVLARTFNMVAFLGCSRMTKDAFNFDGSLYFDNDLVAFIQLVNSK